MQQRLVFTCGAGLGLAVGLLVGFLPEPAQPVPMRTVLASSPTAVPHPGVAGTSPTPGTWLVPDQLAPGVYRTAGSTDPNRQCTWQRFAGPNFAIADTGVGGPGEAQTVTIAPGDSMFRATNCGTWTRVR